MRQFLKPYEKLGCVVEYRNSGHYKITTPNGGQLFCSSTPTDHRAYQNIKRDLRKLGYDLK